MLSLALLDDVQTHNQLLRTLLEQLIAEERLEARVALTTTDAEVLLACARGQAGGVYFLDIALEGELTGVDVCRRLRDIDPLARVIYVSAYPHYAMECVKSHSFDFLLKPFTRDDLRECLLAVARDKAVWEGGKPLVVSLGSGSRQRILDPEEIRYLTTHRGFIAAHLYRGEPTQWRGNFAELLKRPELAGFFPIGRSCAVNLRHVWEISREGTLTMDDAAGTVLRISRRMYGALQNRLRTGSYRGT